MDSGIVLFLTASLLVILAPGPDIIFAITQGVVNGRKAGLLTAAGLALGNTVHVTGALLGLSVILQHSPVLYMAIRIAGALYLFYLAVMALKNIRQASLEEPGIKKETPGLSMVVRGFLMNVLNPKVMIFFVAFFPQFITPGEDTTVQFLVLGVIFISMVFLVFGGLSVLAGTAGARIMSNRKFNRSMNIAAAIVYILLGIKLLLTTG